MSGGLVERTERYLIRKQGSWYRPNAKGYTSSAIQAGRYTLAEAERHTHPNGKDGPRDGMDYLHEDDVADPDWQAYRTQAATITALQAEVAALREALTLAANRMDVMALAVIHENTTRRYEWHEWAIAARDALGGAA